MIFGKIVSGIDDLQDAFFIREQVFQIEQGVDPKIEFDGQDKNAMHAIAYADLEKKNPVATGRIIYDGQVCSIGRVAVLKQYRGMKYGDFIVKLLLNKAYLSGIKKIYINSQLSAKAFYEKLGFIATDSIFKEAGIDHVKMYYDYSNFDNKCCKNI